MSYVLLPTGRLFGSKRSLGIVMLAVASGCSHPLPKIDGAPSAPAARSDAWHPPPNIVPKENVRATPPPLPADIAARAQEIGLNDVVDIALRNNPQTQLSWAQARAGAAAYGASTALYYPSVDATSNVLRTETTSQVGSSERSTIAPALTLTYILYDFGGRSGTVNAARAAAIALDLTHNATLQNVVLQAQSAYLTYQSQRDLLTALEQTVAEADTNVAVAQHRNQAGVATIADVLQAQTLLALAQLDLETGRATLQAARAGLAAVMGVSPATPFQARTVPDTIPIAMVNTRVDTLINRALAFRPDLAALREDIEAARADVKVARSAMLPSFVLGSNLGKTFSDVNTFRGLNYSIQVGISIPIFNLARPYNITFANEQVTAAAARADLLRTQVAQQVYTSYYALQAATERTKGTENLLTIATKSDEAARERYRSGVGTIVDVVTAQTALASARAQRAQARWNWGLALAQLAHDVGVLGPRGEPLPAGLDSTGLRR